MDPGFKERVTAAFDGLAAGYDTGPGGFFGPVSEFLVQVAGLRPPARQASPSGPGTTRPAGTLEHRAGYCRLSGTSSRLDLMARRAGRTISQLGRT